jgi:hypothetical protein
VIHGCRTTTGRMCDRFASKPADANCSKFWYVTAER